MTPYQRTYRDRDCGRLLKQKDKDAAWYEAFRELSMDHERASRHVRQFTQDKLGQTAILWQDFK